MKVYEKPVVLRASEMMEGIYLASGEKGSGCDSKYMMGVYHPQDYSGSKSYSNFDTLGCTGCPAFRPTGCGLQLDQAYLDGATSYNVDIGSRMPDWERQGKDPSANYWD